MSNPFEVPSQDGGGGSPTATGDFDFATAFQDGFEGTKRNAVTLFIVMIAAFFITGFSVLACLLPVLIVGPLVYWGQTKVGLEAQDGVAEVGTLFDGFNNIGEALPKAISYLLILLVIGIPGGIIGGLGNLITLLVDDELVILLVSIVGTIGQWIWQAVIMSRFMPGMFLIIDKGLDPIPAITESWNLTSGCWLKMIGFYVTTGFVALAGVLFCLVGIIPAMMVTQIAGASVYRQLTGTRAA